MAAEEMLTVAELAERWRVSKNFIYDLISKGKLAATNLGEGRAKTRIAESVAAEYIRTRTRKVVRSAPSTVDEAAAA